MKPIDSLSIPEQVILYGKYSPLDTVAKSLFDIDDSMLHIVKELAAERFSPTTISINPMLYESLFKEAADNYEAPRTATRSKRPRGRPGLNIIRAFASIPLNMENRVDAVQFAKEYGITVSSLKQFTRFDRTGMDGAVKVRLDKTTKNLMVWRNSNVEEI